MERKQVGDRQLDALLERLDKLNAEVRALNRRLDAGEHLDPARPTEVRERHAGELLRSLGECTEAHALAVKPAQGRGRGRARPQVHRCVVFGEALEQYAPVRQLLFESSRIDVRAA